MARARRRCSRASTRVHRGGGVQLPRADAPGRGKLVDESAFIEGENAIVDFKYSASPKLLGGSTITRARFLPPMTGAIFWRGRRRPTRQGDGGAQAERWRKVYDPAYISCTSLIADVARENFGFDTKPLKDLIHWANIIDGAKYESAQSAVEMDAPAMKLTMVIESSGEGFVPRVIPLLTEMGLQQVLDQPFIQAELGPLMERHRAGIELLRERTKLERGVITFDITDHLTEGYNKFIPTTCTRQRVQRGAEPVELPDEGRGGNQSVDKAAGGEAGEHCGDLRALRRRRTRARRRGQLLATR